MVKRLTVYHVASDDGGQSVYGACARMRSERQRALDTGYGSGRDPPTT